MSPDDPRHGTTRGFHSGCRQQCCRSAISRYEKETKYRREHGIVWAIPAVGVQRRIRALLRLGWTSTDIAEAAGYAHRNQVLRILYGQKGKPCRYVERATYRRISEVYERLSMTIPPHAPHRSRSRSLAAKKGYHPPLAWDRIDDPREVPKGVSRKDDKGIDSVVVERILAGEWRLRCNRAEREEVCRRWFDRGGSYGHLEQQTGWRIDRYWRKEAS